LDEDALTSLGEEIMTLSEHLQAETHRFLLLIAQFDRLQGWKLHGFASCAEWLAFSTSMKKVTARDHVRVARALAGLPETSAAMARGDLSFSQVRAITRVASEENELELLAHARRTSADGLERLARSWRRLGREDEAALEARRHAERCLSVFPDDEGAYVVRGKLDPEVGALLMRAIEAASDALYRGSVPETTPEQRRADALAFIAERALAMGFDVNEVARVSEAPTSGASAESFSLGRKANDVAVVGVDGAVADTIDDASAEASEECGGTDSGDPRASADVRATRGSAAPDRLDASAEARRGDADASMARAWRSERYLVVLHVDEATLSEGADPGRSELEDGTRVSAESVRRLACDAGVLPVVDGRDGDAPRVHGKTRAVPLRLRRALEIRDRGCRFPGCGSRFTDAHHIEHWADGGATRLDNLILLCKTHHRLLHEGGFRLEPDSARGGRPVFYSPRGVRIPDVPPRMTLNGRAIGSDTKRRTSDSPYGVGSDARQGTSDSTRVTSDCQRWEEHTPLALYLLALESLS
jgi:hypothetical protein